MLAMLMLAAIAATAPFPVAPAGDPDLQRLRDAWQSTVTEDDHRREMNDRIAKAAALPRPDWRAVAEDYFAWRNAEAQRAGALRAEMQSIMLRAAADAASRPVVCTTDTRSEPGLNGTVNSRSKTSCSR